MRYQYRYGIKGLYIDGKEITALCVSAAYINGFLNDCYVPVNDIITLNIILGFSARQKRFIKLTSCVVELNTYIQNRILSLLILFA